VAESAACGGGRRGREEEEKEGEGLEADRWDPPVGAAEKKKRREKGSGPAGNSGWAVWAEKVRCEVLFFFSFLFQTSFSKPNSIQILFKLQQTFLKYFIDFLETTQATKIMQAK
jgi:actin-related protein